MTTPRQTIISRLKAGKDIDQWADLCIYPSGSLFVVELVPPPGPLDLSGLSEEHAAQLREEGELAEYCETPEEAAELYLALEAKYAGKLVAQKDVMRDPPEGTPRKLRPVPTRKVSPQQVPSVDEERFQEVLSSSSTPIAVLFWSPWNAGDRLLLPVIARVASSHSGVRFLTMDAEESSTVVGALKLTATPTLVLFRDGVLHGQVDPPLTEASVREALATLPR